MLRMFYTDQKIIVKENVNNKCDNMLVFITKNL